VEGGAPGRLAHRGFTSSSQQPRRIPRSFQGPEGVTQARVEIYDVLGRLVWSRDLPQAAGELDWSGLDASGRPTSPGVYFAHFRAGKRVKTTRVIRLH